MQKIVLNTFQNIRAALAEYDAAWPQYAPHVWSIDTHGLQTIRTKVGTAVISAGPDKTLVCKAVPLFVSEQQEEPF